MAPVEGDDDDAACRTALGNLHLPFWGSKEPLVLPALQQKKVNQLFWAFNKNHEKEDLEARQSYIPCC